MPRDYVPCRAGQQRYAVTTEAFGRAIKMCRALAADDTQPKPGRRTRCFDPTKDGSRRKTCQILVDNGFATIVPPSYYLPSELQRRQIDYTCGNDNPLMLGPFEGQGDDWSVEYSADHLIVGPVHSDGAWRTSCVDPASLLPFNAPPVTAGDTLSAAATTRAMPVLHYIPDRDECQHILNRWNDETKWICRSHQQNLFVVSACVRGLTYHRLCADDVFAAVPTIATNVAVSASFRDLCHSLWLMGMYQRRWRGPGTPYPIEERDTFAAVTRATVSPRLVGQYDPVTGVPLDAISTAADGAANLLVNCVRMHARHALALLQDRSWLASQEASNALANLCPASLNVQALVPRGTQPTRFVHSLLPMPGSTLLQLIQRCASGQECIRMGSAKLVLTAVMLNFAQTRSSTRDAPWRAQTVEQGDPIMLLDRLSNII